MYRSCRRILRFEMENVTEIQKMENKFINWIYLNFGRGLLRPPIKIAVPIYGTIVMAWFGCVKKERERTDQEESRTQMNENTSSLPVEHVHTQHTKLVSSGGIIVHTAILCSILKIQLAQKKSRPLKLVAYQELKMAYTLKSVRYQVRYKILFHAGFMISDTTYPNCWIELNWIELKYIYLTQFMYHSQSHVISIHPTVQSSLPIL